MKGLEQRLFRKITKACMDFELIAPNDKVMVCLSGGKDSFVLLHMLQQIQRKVPFSFSIVAVNLDQKQPGFPADVLPKYLEAQQCDYKIITKDTYSVVLEKTPEGKTFCTLCSRLRRGILYNAAVALGCTKMALGHHRDDANETLLLNLFFSGQLKSMPAKLISDDRRNVVIRPLIYCAEQDIAEFAATQNFPIIPCNLCGSQDNLQRQRIKGLLAELQQTIPGIQASMLSALTNVRPSHLLDPSLRQKEQRQEPEQEEKQEREQEQPRLPISGTMPTQALSIGKKRLTGS